MLFCNIKFLYLNYKFHVKIKTMNITGGKYNRQKIEAPDENITRPTLSKVRMAVFNTLNSIMDFEGKSFLDMYAGSGIMGLEAVSRGFASVTAIEKNKKAYDVIKSNFSRYRKENNIKLIFGDSLKICERISEKYDVTYIDPPYLSEIYEKSLDVIKNKSDIIILEHITNVDFTGFEIIKQKQYGEKFVTFLKNKP